LSLGGLLGDLGRVVAANRAGQPIDGDVRERVDAMEASLTLDDGHDLAPPADAAALELAERRLGFPLAEDLRRLYAEVADGGFGPGGGLLPISAAVDAYAELRADPPGPRGEVWPERLLPIQALDPGYVCIAEDGQIIDWDPEELAEEAGPRGWQRSFKPAAPSIRDWLEAWVGSRPHHEVLQERLNATMIEQARKSRAAIAAKTPEERRAMGLPEVGWERVVWGGLGLEEDEPPA
jgi:hypothetical protein